MAGLGRDPSAITVAINHDQAIGKSIYIFSIKKNETCACRLPSQVPTIAERRHYRHRETRSQTSPEGLLLHPLAGAMTQEREPLIQNGGAGNAAAAEGSPALLPSLARSVLKFLMWAVFLTWAAGIFLYPTKPARTAVQECKAFSKQSIFGITGTLSLLLPWKSGESSAGIDRPGAALA
jgi:hypothetical protein